MFLFLLFFTYISTIITLFFTFFAEIRYINSMEDERELNLREYFATLLLKAKMGEDIKNEALTLIGNITPRDISIADDSYKTRNEYSLFISSLTDEKELYSLLNSFLNEANPKRKWRLPLILERIVEVLEKSEDDHIFEGDIDKAVLFILSPQDDKKSEIEIQNQFLVPIAVKIFDDYVGFASYPFSIFFEFDYKEKDRKSVISKLEKAFKNTSDNYTLDDYSWLIKIRDKKGNDFNYVGNVSFFPFYSSFSIPYIPKALGIEELDQKDEVVSLSLSYSRLSLDKEEEILEKFEVNRKDGIVKLEHHDKNKNFILDYKDKKNTDKVLSEIDVYSFYPAWIDKDDYPSGDENQPYYKTYYTYSYETKKGRKNGGEGYFTSFDLPKKWSEYCSLMNDKLKYTEEMESLNPDLASMGRTNDDTVFACKVVFSEYSKEYLYIAPDGSFYPGMKALVPAGTNNSLKIVEIKSLHALSKEKDAETISKCKRIISHYPNKDKTNIPI